MAFIRKSKSRSYDLLSSFSWYTPGWGGLIVFLLMFLIGALVAILVGAAIVAMGSKRLLPENFYADYGQLIMYPIMFIPAMMFASAKSRRNEGFETGYAIDNNHFQPLGGAVAAIVVTIAILAVGIALDPLTKAMPEMDEKTKAAMEMMLHGPFWANLLCVSIMAPLFEEWLCRGMVLRTLLNKTHPAVAILLSAVFFALIHGNIWQGASAFIIGCLFGWVYWKTGSLKLTMLMHCVNNTLSLCLSRVPALEDYDTYYDMLGGKLGIYIPMIAAALILVAVCIAVLNRIKPETPKGSCETLSPEYVMGADK